MPNEAPSADAALPTPPRDVAEPPQARALQGAARRCSSHRTVALTLNGRNVGDTVAVTATLAEWLRARGLAGTKIACNDAACGTCTVLIDGAPAFACHTLVAHAAGADVRTIEGLSPPDDAPLSVLQQAFVDFDALQCGYCTPGMIVTLQAALDAGVRDRDDFAQAISGNVCRCGAYAHILDAAVAAAAAR